MELYIGIDVGTSGCRAMAVDENGGVHASTQHPLPSANHIGDLGREQDPQLWWDAVMKVLQELTRQVLPDRIRALAVDGTSATILATDPRGTPLSAGLMYNDARSTAAARRIEALAPAASAARGAGSSLAKALYLRERFPETAHLLHQADWISNRLCGRFGISDENNSLKLGFDPVVRQWPEWMDALPLPATMLPKVVAPATPMGPLQADIARALGLPPSVQVIAGTTDSTAAFIATGASEPGEAVTSLGSTLVVKVLSPEPVFAPQYGIYSHRLGHRWLAGGASNSGGAVLRQHFTDQQLQTMTPLLRPEHPTGLDYYPLPGTGERFPVADPGMAARLAPRPGDPVQFFQGILEGIARIEVEGYRRLQELGAPYPTCVRTVGGGASNPAWSRMRQWMLGAKLIEPQHTEAAYGAALLARTGATASPLTTPVQ